MAGIVGVRLAHVELATRRTMVPMHRVVEKAMAWYRVDPPRTVVAIDGTARIPPIASDPARRLQRLLTGSGDSSVLRWDHGRDAVARQKSVAHFTCAAARTSALWTSRRFAMSPCRLFMRPYTREPHPSTSARSAATSSAPTMVTHGHFGW